MKMSDIVDLIEHYQSPTDWMRVDNEIRDGGDTLVCLEDVSLCIMFNLVWNDSKPYGRLELSYGTTLLSWADIPVGAIAERPSHAVSLQALLGPLRTIGR
jgi:hypothetical protein